MSEVAPSESGSEEDRVEFASFDSVKSKEEDDEENGDESESYSDEEIEIEDEVNAEGEFIKYVRGDGGRVTLEGLKARTELLPVDAIEEKIMRYNLLHEYVGSNNGAISLEVVEYLAQLAPKAVGKVSNRTLWGVHPGSGKGAYPLNLALFNTNCPISVVKLLLDLEPSAMKHHWKGGYGSPLHCYISRALKHEPYGEYNYEDGYWDEYAPAYPDGDLDYKVVKMLVEANPEALTDPSDCYWGTPIHILCRGSKSTLELAKLLIDQDQQCLRMDNVNSHMYRPIWHLLENRDIKPFPTDVFRYLFGCEPSSLNTVLTRHRGFGNFDETLLNLACSNPNITVDAIRLLLDNFPEMIKEEYASDGCLPLHTLCKNGELNEQSSMEILDLLISKYPESALKCTGKDACNWIKDERKLPIHIACIHKTKEFCAYLIEKNPDSVSLRALHYPSASLPRGSSVLPFHLACKYGSLDLAKFLLEEYPDAMRRRTRDDSYKYDEEVGYHTLISVDNHRSSLLKGGDLPLHLASSRKNCPEKIDIINFLLQKDTKAASRIGAWGYLPLHQACKHPSLDVFCILIQSYPKGPQTKNIFGQLPIHILMRYSDGKDLDCILFLAEQYVDGLGVILGVIDVRGFSCAHYACTSEGTLQKLKLISDVAPEALRVKSEIYGFPIHYACQKKCPKEVVQFLADQFPESLDISLERLGLPLHRAAARQPKSDHPDDENKEKHNSFLTAIELVEYLLGKRYNSPFEQGDPTLPIYHIFLKDESVSNKDPILARIGMLETPRKDEEGRSITHLIFGATQDIKLLRRFTHVATLNEKDHNGWLPIHYALLHNAPLEMIQYMMEMQSVESLVTDVGGLSLLHIACSGCSLETIEMLLDYDSELLEKKDDVGDLPFHKACRGGNIKLIHYLIERDMMHVSVRNHLNELSIFLLSDRSNKDAELLESTEYTETILELLLAYPETIIVK